jgi:hypothetical protein
LQGDTGPSLIGIEKRRTPQQIANALTNPEAPMPTYGFSGKQVADVVAYLSQLDGGSNSRPTITLSPAKPTTSTVVSVAFPGEPPPNATVEATMSMGHSTMGTERIKLRKTKDPHVLKAHVAFSMGGAWMIKVHYGTSREVDMPVNVGE